MTLSFMWLLQGSDSVSFSGRNILKGSYSFILLIFREFEVEWRMSHSGFLFFVKI